MTGQSDEIPPGTVVGGRYRIERRLGKGGMGSVYEVEHEVTGHRLAMKLLDPKLTTDAIALERFRRESRAPARIDSDHVVKVTDADVAAELDDAPFLVMELVRGESFDDMLERRGRIEAEEALTYLRQIARALDRAHRLGIIHRDIKPENLILTLRDDGSPCVKLLDFGIAKLTEASGSGMPSNTATGEVFGTPLYMSPEQTLGRTDRISPQTDVWALGIIAHKLLVGSEPWTAETLPHLIAQIAYEPLPVPSERGSELGPAFDAWFRRCCARETVDRFASAGKAVRELGQALGIRDLVSSSQHAIPPPESDPHERTSSALAETAVASSHGAIGSDTLTAQVAPGKPKSRVFVAAGIGALAIIGVVAAISVRSAPTSPTSEPSGNAATAPTPTTPTVTPQLTPDAAAEPPAEDAGVAAPPSASVQPNKPAAPRPVWPGPRPTAKPTAPKPTPTPAVTPTATATTTAPAPKPDPLSGRH